MENVSIQNGIGTLASPLFRGNEEMVRGNQGTDDKSANWHKNEKSEKNRAIVFANKGNQVLLYLVSIENHDESCYGRSYD